MKKQNILIIFAIVFATAITFTACEKNNPESIHHLEANALEMETVSKHKAAAQSDHITVQLDVVQRFKANNNI